MPLFKLGRKFNLRSTQGYIINFMPDQPVYVPPLVVPEAIALGAVCLDGPIDVIPEDPLVPAPPADPNQHRQEILNAMDRIVRANVRTDFTGSGMPTTYALKHVLGYEVDSKQRNDLWAQYLEAKVDQQ